jgi:hypothetical protein
VGGRHPPPGTSTQLYFFFFFFVAFFFAMCALTSSRSGIHCCWAQRRYFFFFFFVAFFFAMDGFTPFPRASVPHCLAPQMLGLVAPAPLIVE